MTKRLLLYTTLVLAVFSAFSCKKDDDDSATKPYLYGLDFDVPTFARSGQTITVKPYGVYYTETEPGVEKFCYKWRLNSDAFEEQPTDDFTFTITEVGNYTVSCNVSDPDNNYYSVTVNKIIIVIDPTLGKTLNGTGIAATDAHVSDTRGKTGECEYYYTKIGDLEWFRNNLAWTGAGLAYENEDVTSYPLGRYYTWDEAMTACPKGWRLPTDAEWATLGTEAGPLMCDAYLNNQKMWEYWPDVPRTNTTGLAVIPSGYALPAITTPTYKRLFTYAAFWTSTVSAEDSRLAAYRYIHAEENEVRSSYAEKGSVALSVRCVR